MAGKNITLKEVNEKFLSLNPKGDIIIRDNNAFVIFNGKKDYKYSFNTPHELAEKLNVMTYAEKKERKGFKILSCGCWTNEKEEYKTCSNCGTVVNESGKERETMFSFL